MMTQLRQRMLEGLQRSLVQPVLGSVRSLTEITSGFTSSVRFATWCFCTGVDLRTVQQCWVHFSVQLAARLF